MAKLNSLASLLLCNEKIQYGPHRLFVSCEGCLFLFYKSIYVSSDEQISAMRKELEKYGIQMPAFSKIGGILASEV